MVHSTVPAAIRSCPRRPNNSFRTVPAPYPLLPSLILEHQHSTSCNANTYSTMCNYTLVEVVHRGCHLLDSTPNDNRFSVWKFLDRVRRTRPEDMPHDWPLNGHVILMKRIKQCYKAGANGDTEASCPPHLQVQLLDMVPIPTSTAPGQCPACKEILDGIKRACYDEKVVSDTLPKMLEGSRAPVDSVD